MHRTKIPGKDTKALRQKLDQIGSEEVTDHRRRVEALNETWPHSIKYVENPGDRSDCMDYALEIPFGLVNVAATFKIDRDFATSRLPGFLETISESEVSEGHVVLYFKDDVTTHVGRMQGNRVISKWGRNPVYEHEIFEVPASYGDECEIFKRPSVYYITSKFIEFVRHHDRYVDISETFEDFVTETQHKLLRAST